MPTLGLLTQQTILEEDPLLQPSTLGLILRTVTWDQEGQGDREGQDWDHLSDQWDHGQCGLLHNRATTGSLLSLYPAGSTKQSNSTVMALPITQTFDHLHQLVETSHPVQTATSALHRHKFSLPTMAKATQDWTVRAQLLRDSRQAMATQVDRTLPTTVLHLITTSIQLHPIVTHANKFLRYPHHHLQETSTTFQRMDFTIPLAH